MKPIQWKALDLLAAGATQVKTAAECGVCAFTVRRWQKRPDFQEALQKETQKLRELAHAQFHSLLKTANPRTKADAPAQIRTF